MTLSRLDINSDRLNANIERIAKIGKQPSGSICRLAFTPEALQARYLIQQWMTELDMHVSTDAAGNLIGKYDGIYHHAPALATGSHIDTVPSGGRYDGALGVLAGLEVVRSLRQNDLRLNHPLEVIVFTDEESTMIGSQAIAGTVLYDEIERYHLPSGKSIQEALEGLGGEWDHLATARRDRTNLAAFVELHVEQGIILERTQHEIGIVQGVVGMRRRKIIITGQANHAGTTPMEMRQDALIAAAKLVLAVQTIALAMPTQPVATVGFLSVLPNAVNIIPGTVELTVDMRDLSKEVLDGMVEQLEAAVAAIAVETDTQITVAPLLCVEPTLAAGLVQDAIAAVCHQLGLSHCHLPSRAGHDSLEVGRITDMGMIFVPSQAGLSHSEAEYTSPEHCAQGATVLLHTLLALDKLYPI
ncbi:hydantoinase/carbamoylase family amidase [Myxacorys almedinensis A]|uniref:Hydantoinase/carbamoylase family amidase n=1 Tax=Myxacorys almedinensis A TaxID=2690445 RepID=A0A8J7YZB1_9CYAN|nr:hydantoinase/carbamoylase family amidase [Myxacorys almedinensis A]